MAQAAEGLLGLESPRWVSAGAAEGDFQSTYLWQENECEHRLKSGAGGGADGRLTFG